MRFHPAKTPTESELGELTHTLAYRIGRYLERQGLLERDAENSYLVGDELDTGPMAEPQGASITYRVAGDITDPDLIRKILDHLNSRAPPPPTPRRAEARQTPPDLFAER